MRTRASHLGESPKIHARTLLVTPLLFLALVKHRAGHARRRIPT